MSRTAYAVTGVILLMLVGAAGFWLGSRGAATGAESPKGAEDQPEVLYWYDPMYPDRHFDAPGKSPFMDMQLVPRYADEADVAREPGVTVAPEAVQSLGVRTAAVQQSVLRERLRAVGSLRYDDREVAVVQSRADGFVERVYDRAPGDRVEAGTPLADLLVPSWAGAQSEFLALLTSGDESLVAAARGRLRLLGMPDSLIRAVERGREPQSVYTVVAPISGALRSLQVRRGMTVRSGENLAEINGLDTVWLDVAVPEAQAARVADGAPARAHLTAFPDEPLHGEVVDVLPDADIRTRTVTVRVELPNPDGRLRPGMLARAEIGPARERTALTVPTEAVIRTGERTLVMLALPEGRFRPAEVVAGAESGDRTVILDGLRTGEQVVVSGQFLLDSEASLSSVPARRLKDAAGEDDGRDRARADEHHHSMEGTR